MLAKGQANKPGSDVIVFTNGDQLAGHFVRSTGSSVTFKSDALGDLTIDWKIVKELRTSEKVAVIRKGVKLRKHQDTAAVPEGTLSVANQSVQLAPATPTIPLSETAVIVGQPDFEKAMTTGPGILQDWKGAITAGATLVRATQNDETFTGALSLVRAEPSENWLNPSNRTSFNLSESYGEVTQPGAPSIKTSIFHGDAERDEYVSGAIFAFGAAAFDHNSTQGLDLEQTYAGGIGWTVINGAAQTFDVKGSMSYMRQQFQTGPTQDLVGSVFAEHYTRKLPRKVVFDEHAAVTPAWNNTNAYSAAFGAMITLPVFKRLSASTGVIDSYLNDPPPAFKKNSFQFTLGLTYSLQ